MPAKTPTKLMSNMPKIDLYVNGVCSKQHRHASLEGGGHCRKAQEYPPQLCRDIAKAIFKQKEWRQRGLSLLASFDKSKREDDKNPPEEDYHKALTEAWDDVDGKDLDLELVEKARAEEILYYKWIS